MATVFDLISSEYGWDDDQILDKSLRRLRQIIAAISLRKNQYHREQRLIASWQTRSLAMVMAAAGSNSNEDLMSFASKLTIDNEEYKEFGAVSTTSVNSNIPVHATTQDEAVQKNFESAAEKNNFDMLSLFSLKVEETPPGQ